MTSSSNDSVSAKPALIGPSRPHAPNPSLKKNWPPMSTPSTWWPAPPPDAKNDPRSGRRSRQAGSSALDRRKRRAARGQRRLEAPPTSNSG
jgi:hypothetical protein